MVSLSGGIMLSLVGNVCKYSKSRYFRATEADGNDPSTTTVYMTLTGIEGTRLLLRKNDNQFAIKTKSISYFSVQTVIWILIKSKSFIYFPIFEFQELAVDQMASNKLRALNHFSTMRYPKHIIHDGNNKYPTLL